MALTHKWFGGAFVAAFGSAGLNLDSGAVTALLAQASFTPDQDTHERLDDVTNELSGGGYARVTLDATTVTYDAGTNKITFDADPFTFAGLTGTFRHIILFVDSGTASTSPLISVISSDVDIAASGNDVTVTPGANGLADVTVS